MEEVSFEFRFKGVYRARLSDVSWEVIPEEKSPIGKSPAASWLLLYPGNISRPEFWEPKAQVGIYGVMRSDMNYGARPCKVLYVISSTLKSDQSLHSVLMIGDTALGHFKCFNVCSNSKFQTHLLYECELCGTCWLCRRALNINHH